MPGTYSSCLATVPSKQAAQTLLIDLKLGGVAVLAPPCDIGDERSLLAALAQCDTVAHPIKGCIHSAMALKVCKDIIVALKAF